MIDIRMYNAAILRKGGGHGGEDPENDVYVSDVHALSGVHALFAYINGPTVDEAGAERTCFCFLRDERPRVKAVTGSGGRFLYTRTNQEFSKKGEPHMKMSQRMCMMGCCRQLRLCACAMD